MSGITYASFQRDFRFEKRLGKGNFATVNQMLHLLDQRSYAHKCIELSSTQQLGQAFNQIQTIKCIDDDRIVKLVYYYVRENKKVGKYELGMIMELCQSNLTEVIKQRKRKNDFFSKLDLKEFLGAMIPFFAKMQRKGYLHRDIKPDNILLVKNAYKKLQYKIGDFGFSIKMNAYSTQNIAGTMEYVSPKLLVKFKDNKIIVPGHNFKDDVYSFGKTLYEYMTLQINQKFNEKKIIDCSNRYGCEYWGLVSLMIKQEQFQRPDFVYLQAYAQRKQLIGVPTPQINKENLLSISTVNGVQSKKLLSLSKQKVKKQSVNKCKGNNEADFTKTRKKDADNQNNITQIQSLNASRVKLKTSRIKDEKNKIKTIGYHEEIHCLMTYENFLFIGSVGRLGIMMMANDKIIKFKLDDSNSPVTALKIDQTKKYLMFGTMNSKLYMVEIGEIKKYIIENHQLYKKKNQIQSQLKSIKYKEYDSGLSISTFDCYLDDKKQMTLIIGHFTGEITIMKGQSKRSIISFSRMPITHLIYYLGYVYTSTGDGVFKRQSSISLGLWNYKQGQNKLATRFSQQKSSIYKYNELFITFQLIDNCKYNDSVKEDNQYLAIVISYDGLAHIISKSFKLQKLVRITQNNIIAASLSMAVNRQTGVQGRIVDTQGKIYSQGGIFVDKTQQKRVSCICTNENGIFLGSYSKSLIQIKNELLIID